MVSILLIVTLFSIAFEPSSCGPIHDALKKVSTFFKGKKVNEVYQDKYGDLYAKVIKVKKTPAGSVEVEVSEPISATYADAPQIRAMMAQMRKTQIVPEDDDAGPIIYADIEQVKQQNPSGVATRILRRKSSQSSFEEDPEELFQNLEELGLQKRPGFSRPGSPYGSQQTSGPYASAGSRPVQQRRAQKAPVPLPRNFPTSPQGSSAMLMQSQPSSSSEEEDIFGTIPADLPPALPRRKVQNPFVSPKLNPTLGVPFVKYCIDERGSLVPAHLFCATLNEASSALEKRRCDMCFIVDKLNTALGSISSTKDSFKNNIQTGEKLDINGHCNTIKGQYSFINPGHCYVHYVQTLFQYQLGGNIPKDFDNQEFRQLKKNVNQQENMELSSKAVSDVDQYFLPPQAQASYNY